MSYLSHSLLAVTVLVISLFLIHDRILQARRHGRSILVVPLCRRHKMETLFFVLMMIYLIIERQRAPHPLLTIIELSLLILLLLYLGWIRRPHMHFKPNGFFFENIFIAKNRIHNLKLTEQGVLLIQLEHKQLRVHVLDLDDLEKIYHQLSAPGNTIQAVS